MSESTSARVEGQPYLDYLLDLDELARALANEEGSWLDLGIEERDRYRRLADVARDVLWRDAGRERVRLESARLRLRWELEKRVKRLESDVRSFRRLLDQLASQEDFLP